MVTAQGKPRLFLTAGWWVAALLLLAIFAFWPVYVVKLPHEVEFYVHLHTAGVVLWMLFLIVQPGLIRSGRRPLHRRIGKISYGLAAYVVVTSLLLAHSRTGALSEADFETFGHSIYLPFAAILLFGICYGLAIANRRDPYLHGRYMVATALPMIDPVAARLLAFRTNLPPDENIYPLIGFGVTDLVLLILLWADRDEPRGRRAFLTLLPVFLLVHLGWFTLARTDSWFDFSAWFVRLPLS